jgi:hypothetical protein
MTHETVWKKLSEIDVNTKTEKKGKLTYLSWAWAWGELMNHFPMASYSFTEWDYPDGTSKDVLVYPDTTCSVECTLTIEDISRTMWLPVMDYRNNAVPDPTAREISDAKMRCLTKCISMFGLGHYIYAGEDLPGTDSSSSPPATNEVAPHKREEAKEQPKPQEPEKRKIPKAQQEQIEVIRNTVTEHPLFTSGGGREVGKQALDVVNGDPSPSQINEWHAYVVGEASMYDNKLKDKELNNGR